MERKVYTRTYWVDHETPVNAENLNKIEKAIYELSEQSLRASDFILGENSGLKINSECGKINFELDSSVIKGRNNSIDNFEVIDDLALVDPTKNNLYIFINDLMENKLDSSYKLIYRGIEYSPEKIKSSTVICSTDQNIEEFVKSNINLAVSELTNSFNGLKTELKQSIGDLEDIDETVSSQLASIQTKVNTLSLKIDMLESEIKDLEDKNNGIIM